MATVSLETESAGTVSMLRPADGSGRRGASHRRGLERADPESATLPVRPIVPDSHSWLSALLIALGLILLWAWLRIA